MPRYSPKNSARRREANKKMWGAVAGVAKKGMESYLRGTESLAKKVEPYMSKLPKGPVRHRRTRRK